MKRLHAARDAAAQIEYHLADGRAPEFDVGQPYRIRLAREYLDWCVRQVDGRASVLELGCGSADISGPMAGRCDVTGVDVVPAAGEAVARRWPAMTFLQAALEDIEPVEVDILVLCETLEHLVDPVDLVKRWLPHAGFVIISHPLDEPDPPYEDGHVWSFTMEDYRNWFALGGHDRVFTSVMPMTVYPRVVCGVGARP